MQKTKQKSAAKEEVKGVQTIELLLELGLISINRTFQVKTVNEIKEPELSKVAKKTYTSIVNMGGKVKVVESQFKAAK